MAYTIYVMVKEDQGRGGWGIVEGLPEAEIRLPLIDIAARYLEPAYVTALQRLDHQHKRITTETPSSTPHTAPDPSP